MIPLSGPHDNEFIAGSRGSRRSSSTAAVDGPGDVLGTHAGRSVDQPVGGETAEETWLQPLAAYRRDALELSYVAARRTHPEGNFRSIETRGQLQETVRESEPATGPTSVGSDPASVGSCEAPPSLSWRGLVIFCASERTSQRSDAPKNAPSRVSWAADQAGRSSRAYLRQERWPMVFQITFTGGGTSDSM